MTNSSKSNKDEKFTLRLDKQLKETLEQVANYEKSMNKSQIIREGLQLWINMRINAIVNPDSDLCMFSLNMLRKALNSMDEEALRQLSNLAYENAKHSIDGVRKIYGDQREKEINSYRDRLDGRLLTLKNAVYGPTGYRWCDSVDYEIEEGKVEVHGKHRLGNNFTQFFRFHISNHMKDFGYIFKTMSVSREINEDNSQVDQIQLVFVKK